MEHDTIQKESALARKIQVYFFYGLLLVVLGLSMFIFLPFVGTFIISGMVAVMLYPIYEKIRGWIGGRAGWAAFLTLFLLLIFIFVPLVIFGAQIVRESSAIYDTISGSGSAYLTDASKSIETTISRIWPGTSINTSEYLLKAAQWVASNFGAVFSGTVTTLFNVAIGFFAMYYFLRDGRKFRDTFIRLSPLPNAYDYEILNRMEKVINGIIKGSLGIALIQGVLCGIGFYVFGVPHAILWGALAAISALVPGIGTALINIPVLVYLFAMGDTTNAIGLSIWAAIAVGMIDNVLSPVLISRGSKIHPIFILFSILGGLAVFGAAGFLLGPLVVGLLFSLLDIYSQEIEAKKD